MLRLLKRPSPIEYSSRLIWSVTFGISAFVFVFLAVFRPFDFSNKISLDTNVASACFAFITFVLVLFVLVTNRYLSKRLGEKWTIGHELLSAFIIATCIGITNHLVMHLIVYTEIFHSYSLMQGFVRSMWMTYAVALFPISIFLLITVGLSNIHEVKSSKSKEADSEDSSPEKVNSLIRIGLDNENVIELNSDSFLFAKASGNYVEFYSFEETLRKDLKRITLAKVETAFLNSDFPALKTHRGYIVNTEKVLSYEGNAQGYLLNFGNELEKVPVSRKQIPDFERVMNS